MTIAQTAKQMAAFLHKPTHRYAAPNPGKTATLSTTSSQPTAIGSISGMKRIERHTRDQIAFASDSSAGSMKCLSLNGIQNQPRAPVGHVGAWVTLEAL